MNRHWTCQYLCIGNKKKIIQSSLYKQSDQKEKKSKYLLTLPTFNSNISTHIPHINLTRFQFGLITLYIDYNDDCGFFFRYFGNFVLFFFTHLSKYSITKFCLILLLISTEMFFPKLQPSGSIDSVDSHTRTPLILVLKRKLKSFLVEECRYNRNSVRVRVTK